MTKPFAVRNIFPGDPRFVAADETSGPLDLALGRALADDLSRHGQTAAALLLRHMIAELEELRRRLERVEAAEIQKALEAGLAMGATKRNG